MYIHSTYRYNNILYITMVKYIKYFRCLPNHFYIRYLEQDMKSYCRRNGVMSRFYCCFCCCFSLTSIILKYFHFFEKSMHSWHYLYDLYSICHLASKTLSIKNMSQCLVFFILLAQFSPIIIPLLPTLMLKLSIIYFNGSELASFSIKKYHTNSIKRKFL